MTHVALQPVNFFYKKGKFYLYCELKGKREVHIASVSFITSTASKLVQKHRNS